MKSNERLTQKDSAGYLYFDTDTRNRLIQRGECIQKLGAYEDTGLTPEEIIAIKAENERLKAEKVKESKE